jgi:hypothetical protein
MTSADGGVLFTWSVNNPGGCEYRSLLFGQFSEFGCVPSTWDVKVTSTATGTTTSTGHLLPAPVLQAQDGSFVGNLINTDDWVTINLAGFNQDGTIKWIGPANYQALLTTSDGGGVAQSPSGQYVTFDQSGNSTGQLTSLPTLSWTTGYQTSSGSVSAVVSPNITLATTYAAIRGPLPSISQDFLENGFDSSPSGNASGNNTAVWQVISPIPPSTSLAKQLPPPGQSLNHNYNSIEILTTASVDTIFTNYIGSFAGAGAANTANQVINDVADIIDQPPHQYRPSDRT